MNEVLAFVGLQVSEAGQCESVSLAKTISEARERAGRLRQRLAERNAHPDVLRFCTEELVAEDYFHAVLEVCKSICEKLRVRTGLLGDGSALIQDACALGQTGVPRLAFNPLQTKSQIMEQNGLVNLMKGVMGAYRDPVAHDPRLSWPISESDAMNVLTLASLIHRRIDLAANTGAVTKKPPEWAASPV